MKMVFLIFILITQISEASTFVGNGGNSTDVELLVTVRQIKKAFQEISEKQFEKEQLCECDSALEGHKICETLSAESNKNRA